MKSWTFLSLVLGLTVAVGAETPAPFWLSRPLSLAESLNIPSNTSGVLISGVLEGGPADKAGMKPGDVLTQVNDQAVNDVVTLLNGIAQTSPGDEAKINLVRKGKPMALKVQVGKRPKSKAKS